MVLTLKCRYECVAVLGCVQCALLGPSPTFDSSPAHQYIRKGDVAHDCVFNYLWDTGT